MKGIILVLMLAGLLYNTNLSKHEKCSLIKIFEHNKIVDYLHPDINSRKTLYLIKNEFCMYEGLTGKGINIVAIDGSKKNNVKNYIEVSSYQKTKTGKFISLNYPIEGAIFNVKLNENDEIEIIEIIEN